MKAARGGETAGFFHSFFSSYLPTWHDEGDVLAADHVLEGLFILTGCLQFLQNRRIYVQIQRMYFNKWHREENPLITQFYLLRCSRWDPKRINYLIVLLLLNLFSPSCMDLANWIGRMVSCINLLDKKFPSINGTKELISSCRR